MTTTQTQHPRGPGSPAERPPSRASLIRQQVMVLSGPFHASYLEWFRRLGEQAMGDEDVQAILGAAVAEVNRLEIAHRTGRVRDASLATARKQIRDLLEAVLAQERLTQSVKDKVSHLIIELSPVHLLDVPGFRFTQDWFSFHEAWWLEHFGSLADRAGVRALEVGSFEGRSACWMLEHLLTGPGSTILCVDRFDSYAGQERNFDHNIRATGAEARVTKLRGRSQQVLPFLMPSSYDFIYVDGSHGALDVILDAAMCWRLLKPGAVIVFDDYESAAFPGLFEFSAKPAVDAFLALVAGSYDLLFKDWQVAIAKRGDVRLASSAGVRTHVEAHSFVDVTSGTPPSV